MNDVNPSTTDLLHAAQIGHAVAALLTASGDQHDSAAVAARTLAKKLAEQATMLTTTTVTINADVTVGAGNANLTPTTLQEYLTADHRRGVIDHVIRSSPGSGLLASAVEFYIRPANVDGETRQFNLSGNRLNPFPPQPPSGR